MKKLLHTVSGVTTAVERRWLLPLVASSFVSLSLVLLATSRYTVSQGSSSSTYFYQVLSIRHGNRPLAAEVETLTDPSLPKPPSLAYLISGSKGDGERMTRLLQAVYHPRNHYIFHLDRDASSNERIELAKYVKLHPIISAVGNVYVIGKANTVTYKGSSMTACTLHAAAILLKKGINWDWFINLSASDYPLVTQDELLNVFSYIPRDLNFIEHTSDIDWKEYQRAKPIIVDPGLYSHKKADIFWATQRRSLPNAFKLFLGSAWVALTRSFIEYCVFGWDNLPRTVLMYYSNFVSSNEGYFHTVICNAREFQNTTVNHDLHYIAWDNPPKEHPLSLGLNDFQNMIKSGAAFARRFEKDDPVLDKIDKDLLQRTSGRFTAGGWCVGSSRWGADPCREIGDISILKPGIGAKRLEGLLLKLLSPENFRANQCSVR